MDAKTTPKLKYTVQTNHLQNAILLRTSGMTHAINDDNGEIKHLLDLMNGERSINDICQQMKNTYPSCSTDDTVSFIESLDGLKLVEDTRSTPSTLLSEYDLERWGRNINFFGSFCHLEQNKYDFQQKIKQAKITLLGLGGLGSHLLYDLAALGFTNIQAMEFDKVELSNLNRQILYNESDVGKSKAKIAKERIKQFSQHLDFNVIEKKIAGTTDVKQAIQGSDLVICVADRPKMEILDWVNEACVGLNIPLITGGLDTQRARYYSMIPGTSGCLQCWRNQVTENDDYSHQVLTEQRKNQLRGDNAAFVPFVAIIAGLMTAEAVKIITGITPPIAAGKVHEIDFASMNLHTREQWQTNDNCPICQL